jgi:hypothetical protein
MDERAILTAAFLAGIAGDDGRLGAGSGQAAKDGHVAGERGTTKRSGPNVLRADDVTAGAEDFTPNNFSRRDAMGDGRSVPMKVASLSI